MRFYGDGLAEILDLPKPRLNVVERFSLRSRLCPLRPGL